MHSDGDRYVPPKPSRNTIVDPPCGIENVQTYNGFNYDENVESMKLAIRRSEPVDGVFRVLEALRTSTECGHHTVKELLLSASLEIGPANPSMIVMIDNLIGRDVLALDYENVMTAVQLLCLSPKSRLFASMYQTLSLGEVTQRHEVVETALKTSLVYVETYLLDNDFQLAIQEAYKLYRLECHVDINMWNRLSRIFLNPMRAKSFRKASATFWLPVLSRAERCESQRVCNLVHRIYNIAHARSKYTKIALREDKRVFSLWIHALWVLCNPERVENTWYDDGNIRLIPDGVLISDQERNKMVTSHLRREMLIGSHPDTVNMFTLRGRQEGKGWDHFINNCAFVEPSLSELHAEETIWLQRWLDKMKKE